MHCIFNLLPEYHLDFTYQFYDFSYRSDEEIKGQAILKIYHTLIKEISNPNNNNIVDSIVKALNYLSEIENKKKGTEYLETVMRYIFDAGKNLSEKDINQMVDSVTINYPEGSDVIMTLADHFIEKGKVAGLEEGLSIGISQTILQLLTKRFQNIPEDLIVKIEASDVKTLETIADHIFEYESIEDVWKYLQ